MFAPETDFDQSLGLPIEWLTRHGFPSFQEFSKNPDKWRSHHEELLASADQSSAVFRAQVQKQRYFWRDTYEADSLEKLQEIAINEGCLKEEILPDGTIHRRLEVAMEPLVRPLNGTDTRGALEVHIHFWPKTEFALRGGVVPDEA